MACNPDSTYVPSSSSSLDNTPSLVTCIDDDNDNENPPLPSPIPSLAPIPLPMPHIPWWVYFSHEDTSDLVYDPRDEFWTHF